MKTSFPGMDPYLEHSALWQDVHNSLVVSIANAITLLVAPRYYVALKRRTYFPISNDVLFLSRSGIASTTKMQSIDVSVAPIASGVLDVEVPMKDEVGHDYLEICEARTGKLVTLVEVLSPTNKLDMDGRQQYKGERAEMLLSLTNLVEIDLLRAGEPMAVVGRAACSDYRVLISRGHQRPRAQLYCFTLRQPIPHFPLPLLPGEMEPLVDLNAILHEVYTRARFDLRLDYSQPAVPPLSSEDTDWAATLDYPPTPEA